MAQTLRIRAREWFPVLEKMLLRQAEGYQTMKLGASLRVDTRRVIVTCNIPEHVVPKIHGAMLRQALYRPQKLDECWSFGGGHKSVILYKVDDVFQRLKILKTDGGHISVLSSYYDEDLNPPELLCAFQTDPPYVEIRRCWRFQVEPTEREATNRIFWGNFLHFRKDPVYPGTIYMAPEALPYLNDTFECVVKTPTNATDGILFYARRKNVLITKLDEHNAKLMIRDNGWTIDIYARRETLSNVYVYYEARSCMHDVFTVDLYVSDYI